MAGGTNFRTSVECAMSLAPVGEFSFIIATLGISLGAISEHIYPIIVSVSVVTTFVTPYMIKLAKPIADKIEPHIPEKFKREIARNESASESARSNRQWRQLHKDSAITVMVYTVLSIAIIEICEYTLFPYLSNIIPDIWARVSTLVVSLIALLAFVRPIVVKGLYDERYWGLWNDKYFNRAPLVLLSAFRALIAVTLVTYAIHNMFYSTWVVLGGTIMFAVAMWILSRQLIKGQNHLESVFMSNFNSKENNSDAGFARDLMDRNLHLTELQMPVNSKWCGKTVGEANWGRLYGVHITSILRDSCRINIPSIDMQLFPGDKIQLIGSDDNLTLFAMELKKEENMVKLDSTTSDNTIEMARVVIPTGSCYDGKKIKESQIRKDFRCMIVGLDRGADNLIRPLPDNEILGGDMLWVAGESSDIKALREKANDISSSNK